MSGERGNGEDKAARGGFWARLAFGMMCYGVLFAIVALLYPVWSHGLDDMLGVGFPELSGLDSLFLALIGFGAALVGCIIAVKRRDKGARDEREGAD